MTEQLTRRLLTTTPKSGTGLALAAATMLAAGGVLASAVLGWVAVFLVAVLVQLAADLLVEETPLVRKLFNQARLGLATRAVMRELAVVLLLTRADLVAGSSLVGMGLAITVVAVLRHVMLYLDGALWRLNRPAVETLNLQVAPLGKELRAVPIPSEAILVVQSALLVVLAVIVALGAPWWSFLLGASVVAAFSLVAVAKVARSLWHNRSGSSTLGQVEHVARSVRELRPEAILYFSGTPTSVYQADMWLRVMEQIGRPVLVVLRERANLALLAPTSLPVVCVPRAVDLMDFRVPSVRVAFYVAHVGKNLHLLREPRMKSVFIGHGESDKVASVNPFTKAYDEIWVAGAASRERWLAAQVGVRNEAIVEVGRPQLGEVQAADPRDPQAPLRVLYAPTWEGWTADPFASSVPTMGAALVDWLLAREEPTQLVYKPHPLIGSVSSASGRAHAAIVAKIRAANQRAARPHEHQHRVVDGPSPTLYTCFNESDVLVGDISSVVPDYVASGKPYFVTNAAGIPSDTVRKLYASTRGAYILDNTPDTWESEMQAAVGPDPRRPERERLRIELLGPRQNDPMDPWRHALGDLIDRARAEWPRAEEESALVDHD